MVAVLALASATATQAGNITAKGSDTLVILAQKWAEVYMAKTPGTTIQVTGGGSGTGFAALQNQSTDLANASRKIKAAEITACVKAFNKRPTEYKVCLDGLSVYVNAENPIKELTLTSWRASSRAASARGRNWVVERASSRSTAGRTAREPMSSSRSTCSRARTLPPRPSRCRARRKCWSRSRRTRVELVTGEPPMGQGRGRWPS